MPVYIESLIKLDRFKLGGLGIAFGLFVFFKTLVKDFKSIIKDSEYKKSKLLKHKNIRTSVKQYKASITYQTANKQVVLRIEAGSSKNKRCYVTWEFWPKNIKHSGVHQFIEAIECLMGNEPCFTYKIAYQVGKITYIELACDLKTPNIHNDLIFWKMKTQKGGIYMKQDALNDGSITKGSIYLGAKDSALQFCIYDKAKQLRETGQDTPWLNYTRIEARLQKTKLKLNELVNIKSPFPNLHIANAIDCKEKWQEPEWIQFIECALEHTYPVAIAPLDKVTRKKFHDRLKQCSVKFWKPEGLLINLYKEVRKLHPIHIQPKLINYSI